MASGSVCLEAFLGLAFLRVSKYSLITAWEEGTLWRIWNIFGRRAGAAQAIRFEDWTVTYMNLLSTNIASIITANM
jgi:hypothetical protein